jgi:hypothetical protein
MFLNIKILKLIILQNAIVVCSYNEYPTQSLFINYISLFFPVGASISKPFAEPTFEQAIYYVKNIPLLNQFPLLLKTDLELY